MKKHLLLRSVAIFSLLALIMMLSLGQLALAQPLGSANISRLSSGEDPCGKKSIVVSADHIQSRFSYFAASVDGQNFQCAPFVQICEEKPTRREDRRGFLDGFFGEAPAYGMTSQCLRVEAHQMTEVSADLMEKAMLMLVQAREADESQSPRLRQIKKSLLEEAKVNGSAAALEALKSHLYNEATLLGGS